METRPAGLCAYATTTGLIEKYRPIYVGSPLLMNQASNRPAQCIPIPVTSTDPTGSYGAMECGGFSSFVYR